MAPLGDTGAAASPRKQQQPKGRRARAPNSFRKFLGYLRKSRHHDPRLKVSIRSITTFGGGFDALARRNVGSRRRASGGGSVQDTTTGSEVGTDLTRASALSKRRRKASQWPLGGLVPLPGRARL